MISDNEFLELLKNYEITYAKGDIIKGIIVGYEGNDVLVDIKAKTAAICPNSEILVSKDQNSKDILQKGEEYDLKGLEKCDKNKTFANVTINYKDGTAKKTQVELKC